MLPEVNSLLSSKSSFRLPPLSKVKTLLKVSGTIVTSVGLTMMLFVTNSAPRSKVALGPLIVTESPAPELSFKLSFTFT